MNLKFTYNRKLNSFLVLVPCIFLLNTVNCQTDATKESINSTKSSENVHLVNVLNFLPQSIRESARNYIASRLRRVAMYPIENKAGNKIEEKEILVKQPMMGFVPIIPDDQQTPKWVPGELIASQITKRQLRQIDESMYGPLKSATMFPSVMSTIIVFQKRYDPERLAEVLKFNFGIESEPNGMITELSS